MELFCTKVTVNHFLGKVPSKMFGKFPNTPLTDHQHLFEKPNGILLMKYHTKEINALIRMKSFSGCTFFETIYWKKTFKIMEIIVA